MADHAGFLNAISSGPGDDTPRLIYADWLEENGEPERGEFIRVQCRAASMPASDERDALEDRAADLLREHQRRWLEPVPEVNRVEFHRGFLNRAEMDPLHFLSQADALFRLGPACTVGLRLHRASSRLGKIVASPAIKRLAGLHLIDAGADLLAKLGELPRLRRLELSNRAGSHRDDSVARDALRTLIARPWFSRLQVLRVSGWPFGDEEVELLTEKAEPGCLRGLVLRGCTVTSRGVQLLAGSPALSRLEVLGLDDRRLDAGVLSFLANSANLGNLRALCLEGIGGPAQMKALLPLMRRLSWLSLNAGSVSLEGLRALASIEEPVHLKTLILRQCGLTVEGLRLLTSSPLGRRLRELDLGASQMTVTLLKVLLARDRMKELRGLSLAGNSLNDEAAEVLMSWKGFHRLRWLDLAGTGISGENLCTLVASTGKNHLVSLRYDSALKGAELLKLLAGPGVGKLAELTVDCQRCKDEELRAVARLTPPRLAALAVGTLRGGLLEELQTSPLGQRLCRPIRRGNDDARVAWVKRNCALNLLGPSDEEY